MSYFRRGLMMAQQKIENPYDFNGTDQYLDTGIKLWTGQPFTLMLASRHERWITERIRPYSLHVTMEVSMVSLSPNLQDQPLNAVV